MKKKILTFLTMLGPGIIAALAGNDAGGIASYASAGADYGYQLLWVMGLLLIGLIVVQEMSVKLGAVTGKGFADLVRENFSLKTTFFVMSLFFIANTGIVVSEFAGIAAALELFGITKYISVPLSALAIWFLVVKGSYQKIERIFLLMSTVFISYVLTAFLAKPDWGVVAHSFVKPYFEMNSSFLKFLLIIVGTTISPYMQLFAQSSVVDKGASSSELGYELWDARLGAIFSTLVATFIIIATAATLHQQHISIHSAADAARALAPLAGNYATILFGVGLLGASFLAAGVLPLTTSFSLADAFGWESGLNRNFNDAPIFYAVFTFIIVLSATIILSPSLSLINLLINLQLLNSIVLPFELFIMIKLCNNKNLMGKHTNSLIFNVVAWITMVVVGGAAILYFISPLIGI